MKCQNNKNDKKQSHFFAHLKTAHVGQSALHKLFILVLQVILFKTVNSFFKSVT